MYSGRVGVDGINPAKIMKLLTAADLYQVKIISLPFFPEVWYGWTWFFEMKLLYSLYNIFFCPLTTDRTKGGTDSFLYNNRCVFAVSRHDC